MSLSFDLEELSDYDQWLLEELLQVLPENNLVAKVTWRAVAERLKELGADKPSRRHKSKANGRRIPFRDPENEAFRKALNEQMPGWKPVDELRELRIKFLGVDFGPSQIAGTCLVEDEHGRKRVVDFKDGKVIGVSG